MSLWWAFNVLSYMRKFTTSALFVSAVLSGCTDVQPVKDKPAAVEPAEVPEIESFPEDMLRDEVPENVQQEVEGSDAGFTDKSGFFITIGEGVASLGDPTVTGVWIRAPFIEAEEELKIYSRETDLSVVGRAIPYDGNMQMSLAAFQALSLNPATLPLIEVRTR